MFVEPTVIKRSLFRRLAVIPALVLALALWGCSWNTRQIAPAAPVTDLPLIVYPPQSTFAAKPAPADTLIVMLSGDGGWAGLDKALGQSLFRAGYGVVGWSSFKYFLHHHEPAEAAVDLDRVIRTYSKRWDRDRIVLIGYSRGADVLPFLYNRLPATTQPNVSHIVLLGLADHITFGYTLLSWIGLGGQGRAVIPEARQLPPHRTSCLYGISDPEAVCNALRGHGFDVLGLAGGHHFDHRYDRLAHEIEKRIAPDTAS